MFKISYLKIVVVVVLVLLVASIGYAEWKNLDESNKSNNLNDATTELVTTNSLKISEIDTSHWKTFRHDDYNLEVKYPPYYYAVPTTDLGPLWRTKKTLVFSLILNEVHLEVGSRILYIQMSVLMCSNN